MPKIGVIHYNFPDFSLEDFLHFCADTGYEYAELSVGDLWDEKATDANPEGRAEEIRRQMQSMGLKVCALSAANDFVLEDRDAMQEQIVRMKRVARLAGLLGCQVLRTEGGQPKDQVPRSRWASLITEGLKHCAEIGEELGVHFALDNHGHCTNDGELQVQIFERVGSDFVGANLDTMNYRWAGHELETIRHFYDIVAPYTLHTHMKDGTGSGADYRGAALGEGEIELLHAIRVLKEAGYDGVWTAEYEGPEAAGGVGYAKCYRWLKAHV